MDDRLPLFRCETLATPSSPMGRRVSMEVDADGAVVITMSNPPVNALHPNIIAGLKEKYTEAMARDDVKAIVVTGDGGVFSGGFDINIMAQVHKTEALGTYEDWTLGYC